MLSPGPPSPVLQSNHRHTATNQLRNDLGNDTPRRQHQSPSPPPLRTSSATTLPPVTTIARHHLSPATATTATARSNVMISRVNAYPGIEQAARLMGQAPPPTRTVLPEVQMALHAIDDQIKCIDLQDSHDAPLAAESQKKKRPAPAAPQRKPGFSLTRRFWSKGWHRKGHRNGRRKGHRGENKVEVKLSADASAAAAAADVAEPTPPTQERLLLQSWAVSIPAVPSAAAAAAAAAETAEPTPPTQERLLLQSWAVPIPAIPSAAAAAAAAAETAEPTPPTQERLLLQSWAVPIPAVPSVRVPVTAPATMASTASSERALLLSWAVTAPSFSTAARKPPMQSTATAVPVFSVTKKTKFTVQRMANGRRATWI